ncbi:MAG TPA: SDR family NAD(P)-dependent oxidoreductase [Methylomirabilota bacterium]|nr:SDR family NAD(P)-dependent oxidoreductase [Methylomirabilota bacterium]
MDLELRDKVVLVTGAGQGLGRAIGLAFAREGAHVAFHYHASAAGAETAGAETRQLGVKAVAVAADLRDDAAVAGWDVPTTSSPWCCCWPRRCRAGPRGRWSR